MANFLDVIKRNIQYSYIIALALVAEAGMGLYFDKINGSQFVEFSAIIAAAYGIVGVIGAIAEVVKARADKGTQA